MTLTRGRKRDILWRVVNNNFTFSDLSPKYINVDSSTGNIFCPFHENHESPAAKMYWDDYRNIWLIHCFGECHRSFTAYDYVELILCEKYQRYNSPYQFLKERLSANVLASQIEYFKKEQTDATQDYIQEKIRYINNLYTKYENVTGYIEELYTS